MQDKSKFQQFVKSGLQRPLLQNKILFIIITALAVLLLSFLLVRKVFLVAPSPNVPVDSKLSKMLATFPPTPTPTPKPLTFSEMNQLYGPCVHLPVLMYHHVQTEENAKANKQTSLTVYTDYFEKQMQYLSDKGYHAVAVKNLIDFFDNGTPIQPKSVLITFDDGYEDFFTDARPILEKLGFPATMFIPTGLIGNPGYLTWNEIASMNGQIYFANHTWSHKNVMTTSKEMEYEILTADTQLIEHGLNSEKIFAYPYGLDSASSEKYLASLDYKIAFITTPGSILCAKQRLALPRIRIGNAQLSSYGF